MVASCKLSSFVVRLGVFISVLDPKTDLPQAKQPYCVLDPTIDPQKASSSSVKNHRIGRLARKALCASDLNRIHHQQE